MISVYPQHTTISEWLANQGIRYRHPNNRGMTKVERILSRRRCIFYCTAELQERSFIGSVVGQTIGPKIAGQKIKVVMSAA